jgi:hypothetical protein
MGRRSTQGLMKNASVRQSLSIEPLPSPCHPDRSGGTCGSADPSWKCFSDRAKKSAVAQGTTEGNSMNKTRNNTSRLTKKFALPISPFLLSLPGFL